MIKIIEHPLAKYYLTKLRDKNTSSNDFRIYAEKLGFFLAYKACETLEVNKIEIQTPLKLTNGHAIKIKLLSFLFYAQV